MHKLAQNAFSKKSLMADIGSPTMHIIPMSFFSSRMGMDGCSHPRLVLGDTSGGDPL